MDLFSIFRRSETVSLDLPCSIRITSAYAAGVTVEMDGRLVKAGRRDFTVRVVSVYHTGLAIFDLHNTLALGLPLKNEKLYLDISPGSYERNDPGSYDCVVRIEDSEYSNARKLRGLINTLRNLSRERARGE